MSTSIIILHTFLMHITSYLYKLYHLITVSFISFHYTNKRKLVTVLARPNVLITRREHLFRFSLSK